MPNWSDPDEIEKAAGASSTFILWVLGFIARLFVLPRRLSGPCSLSSRCYNVGDTSTTTFRLLDDYWASVWGFYHRSLRGDLLIYDSQRKTRWTFGLYLWCKYSLWFGIIGVNIALNVTSRVNCQARVSFGSASLDVVDLDQLL